MPRRVYDVKVVIANDEDGKLSVCFVTPEGECSEGELVDYKGIWNVDVDVDWGDEYKMSQQIVQVRVRAKMLDEVMLNWSNVMLHYVSEPGVAEGWHFVLRLESRIRFVPSVGYREDGFRVKLMTSRR